MADFSDDYYAEVDNAFSDLRRHPFKEDEPVDQTVPQERGVPMSPAGWVENADSSGNPTVRVDADGLHVESGTVGDGSGVTIDTDGILVKDSTPTDRVRLGLLSAGTYGLRVVASDGTTVIIDGESNMFKIAATGTTSVAVGTTSSASADVTLTGLGALPTTPAHVSLIARGNTIAAAQYVSSMIVTPSIDSWAATQLNGATTREFLALHAYSAIRLHLNGSSQALVRIEGYISGASAETFYGRYYVLQEAAL